MRYRLLGRSGLRVCELCLGTMTFGEDWGWGADEPTSRAIFETFTAAGGTFIDTASNYTNGTAERFVGEFIEGRRDEYVLATKYTLAAPNRNLRDPHLGGNARKSMMRSVRTRLDRLQTDYVDLLYLHAWDFTTPVEEVLRAADDLVRAGAVHYFAFSDTPAWIVSYAVALAERHGWPRPLAVQVPYSLIRRDVETDYFPLARTFDLALPVWGTLGGGALTGRQAAAPAEPRRVATPSQQAVEAATVVGEVAREVGCTPAQVAVAWARHQRAPVGRCDGSSSARRSPRSTTTATRSRERAPSARFGSCVRNPLLF
jgi:aryl-alcohol dehydrogenase-like predicted oxidoreductase